MRKRNYDLFSIWLGITMLALAIIVFWLAISYEPGFFQDIALVL